MPGSGDSETRKLPRAAALTSYLQANRARVLATSLLLTGAIAALDWAVEPNLGLGFLYLFPLMLAGASLPRWALASLALLCALLRENFGPFQNHPDAPARIVMVFVAFAGVSFFVSELARNRRLAIEHLREIEIQSDLRRQAEEQFRILVESSPAAIVTLDGSGKVLMANEAAHRLFGCPGGALAGQDIARYLPALATIRRAPGGPPAFRSVMECRGTRRDSQPFLASVWFSTYATNEGERIAAIIADNSEDLRDREESGLHRMLRSTRVLIGAVSHEIRNFASAIAVMHTNIVRSGALSASEDFRAMGSLVQGLERIAGAELRQLAEDDQQQGVNMSELLEELRIVVAPELREAEVKLAWEVPRALPTVRAERQTVLQVLLNLVKNSVRAMSSRGHKELRIAAGVAAGRLTVRIYDTGGGVAVPDRLFQPYQSGADSTGLGLYLSRALVRAFQGELRYDPQEAGSCFTIELPLLEGEGE